MNKVELAARSRVLEEFENWMRSCRVEGMQLGVYVSALGKLEEIKRKHGIEEDG